MGMKIDLQLSTTSSITSIKLPKPQGLIPTHTNTHTHILYILLFQRRAIFNFGGKKSGTKSRIKFPMDLLRLCKMQFNSVAISIFTLVWFL